MDLIRVLPILGSFPVLANDMRFVSTDTLDLKSAVLILASICPFCVMLGYLTPRLIDEYTGGNPADAGRAYALNVLGCILGPLVASYVLLPFVSERHALVLLSLPFVLLCFAYS